MIIFTHCLQWILSENKLLHVTGVACVVNSLVIKCLYQALLQHYCTCAGETPDDIRLLLCALTGKAAFSIVGQTVCHALRILLIKRWKANP